MKKWIIIIILVIVIVIVLGLFINYQLNKQKNKKSKMELESPVFEDGMIPSKYTCDGENVNPELNLEHVPENAESLALIVDDPDAPKAESFVHWVVFNIDSDTTKVEENSAPNGIEGKNDFGDIGYGGPCPPSGTHRYQFKLYALDTELDLDEGISKEELLEAMEGHILEKDELIGLYCCKKKENK